MSFLRLSAILTTCSILVALPLIAASPAPVVTAANQHAAQFQSFDGSDQLGYIGYARGAHQDHAVDVFGFQREGVRCFIVLGKYTDTIACVPVRSGGGQQQQHSAK